MKEVFAVRRLDLKVFAEEGGQIARQDDVAQFPRLLAETQGSEVVQPVTWSAQGELRNVGHAQPGTWLLLKAQVRLPMTCQRCLEPVEVPAEVDRWFRFVADENVAAAQDDESEEDLLAMSRSFDLMELLEDELLMALPVAPRHALCPGTVTLAAEDADFDPGPGPQRSPFAALQKLKTSLQ